MAAAVAVFLGQLCGGGIAAATGVDVVTRIDQDVVETATADGLSLNVVTSFQAVNVPEHYLRHRLTLGELTRVNNDLDRRDASFIVRPALSGTLGAVSFEAVNYPGHFLRHQSFRLKLHRHDGSELFRQDASFIAHPGLAYAAAASFEAVNVPGHFIRHRNFNLWIDPNDGSELFRRDASFEPEYGLAGSVSVGAGTMFESVNYPGYFIRHRFALGRITRVWSGLDSKDATFILRPALSGPWDAVSFEATNYPGHFLRHQNFRLKLHKNDGSDLFLKDASFIVRPGLSRLPDTVSFEAVNVPGHFLRHTNYELWIAPDDGSDLFRMDASFRQPQFAPEASWESLNVPNHFIRHRFSLGELTPVARDSNLDRQDATFIMRPGLGGQPGSVSFESVNYPGHFLRHQNFRLVLSRDDGSDSNLFRQDASFYQQPGLADGHGKSFESVNMPGHFLRHRDYHLWVEQNDGSDLFRWDASFRQPRQHENTGHGLYVSPGHCTRFFRSWRNGAEDESLLDICPWVMGIGKHCEDRDAFVAVAYDADGRYLTCAPYSHPDDILEQAEHIARGVSEGLVTAYVAAAPYLEPAISGIACLNGVVYGCATLALQLADQAGLELPGEAAQAIEIAEEVTACIEGSAIDCAQLGARGARAAGVTIPGEDAVHVAEDAQQCGDGDFRACIRLGLTAANAAGAPVDLGSGDELDIQGCLEGDEEACLSLAQRVAQRVDFPLDGVTQGAENARQCASGDPEACTALGRALAAAAR
jgi:hypothetical protein